MESTWINLFFTCAIAVLGLLWRDLSRKLAEKVNIELCAERSAGITRQLEHQEEILIRTEQRMIRIEKKLAYQNGEAGHEFDRD